jgi:hypothetical protein
MTEKRHLLLGTKMMIDHVCVVFVDNYKKVDS